MKRPEDPIEDGLVEAWLDGRLEGRDALAFQERLDSDPGLAAELELAERIQDALRRSFVPPRLHAPLPEPAAAPVTVRTRDSWRVVGGFLAAAAAVLLVIRVLGGGGEPPSPGPVRGIASAGPVHVAAVGPIAEADGRGVGVSAPDLALLYAETLADARGAALTCGPEDDLGAALAASYGEPVTVRPEASQMLNGPYGSPRWPTGTIYTGHAGPGNRPSVLVAERDATHRCCVLFELGEGSDLNLFTWQVGDLVLTEITPEREPRLIGFFE